MTSEVKREVENLFKRDASKKHFAMDASIASQSRILFNALSSKFDKMFSDLIDYASNAMINSVNKASTSSLFASYKELTGGAGIQTDFTTSKLNNVITASLNENASLIKSIPDEFLNDVSGAVNRSITSGQGLYDLVPYIEKVSGQTHRRAKNIALDQTRKAYSSINVARMKAAGIKKWEWIHSHGGLHPRKLHLELSGKIFTFDEPPIINEKTGVRGYPAQEIFCKCTMRPVIEFDDD